tara:strand:- start:392 stop:856 length:465 start_codon:yes stop_codon:yes gene_type:complete
MKLKVLRFSSQKDSTNGLLFDVTDGINFLCYTLEDEQRDIKVKAETRIPSGVYKILFRKEGGFHEKYTGRYGSMHKGMLHVQDVPGFKWILIHTGNTDEHTAGCLILGDSQENNITTENGFIGKSTTSYKRVYPMIAKALEKGEEVFIEYIDFD